MNPKYTHVYTLNLKRVVSIAGLTQTAVAEVLPETHVAQLGGRDLAHLQSHSGALAHRLHAHTHRLHFQYQHRHLGGQEEVNLTYIFTYI